MRFTLDAGRQHRNGLLTFEKYRVPLEIGTSEVEIMAKSVAIIADPKEGKTYKKEIEAENLASLSGRKIGDEIDGIFFNLPGYKLKVTGGTSNDGFPMRPDLAISGKKKVLVTYKAGRRGKSGIRRRLTLRGSIIGTDIAQLNLKVTQYGPGPIVEAQENKEAAK